MDRDTWLEAVWKPYEGSPVPTIIIGPRNRILRSNRAMTVLSGYTHEEMPDLSTLFRNVMPNRPYRQAAIRTLRAAREGTLAVVKREFSITRKDGTERFAEITVYRFENAGNCLLVQWFDGTDQHRSFEDLMKSREMFRSQYVSIPIPTFTWRRTEAGFLLVDLNREAEELARGEGARYVGESVSALFPEAPGIAADMERCFSRKESIRREDFWTRFAPIEETRCFELTHVSIPPHFVMTHADDVTEDKQVEGALQESLDRYRTLFEKANDAVLIHGIDGMIRESNRTAARMLGFGKKQLVDMNLLQLLPGDDRPRVEERLSAAVRKAVRFEAMIVNSRGRHIDVDVSTVAVDQDRGVLQSIIRNVTSEKQYREALKRAKNDLEQTVRERTHELTEANRLLQIEIRNRQQHEEKLVEMAEQLKQANSELKHLSLFDGLTNIPNRRSFDQVIDAEWKRAKRDGGCVSLVLVDIDFFKLFNDTYGHLRGDECLKTVAKALRETVHRPADFVARYGGEEFAVILPGTGLEGAGKIAAGISRRVKGLNIRHETSRVSDRLTLSMGIASAAPHSSMRLTRLIQSADEALYRAKERGRDRIESAVLDTAQVTCKNT